MLAEDAIQAALKDYKLKNTKNDDGGGGVVGQQAASM